MSKIVTYKGQIPDGLQTKIHLSTADGLTGYRINKFQIMGRRPGQDSYELIAKMFTTDQTGSITGNVDLNDTDLLAVVFHSSPANAINYAQNEHIIFDKELINQDVFITASDVSGSANATNYYLELEQFKINLNESTVTTLRNLRSNQQQ